MRTGSTLRGNSVIVAGLIVASVLVALLVYVQQRLAEPVRPPGSTLPARVQVSCVSWGNSSSILVSNVGAVPAAVRAVVSVPSGSVYANLSATVEPGGTAVLWVPEPAAAVAVAVSPGGVLAQSACVPGLQAPSGASVEAAQGSGAGEGWCLLWRGSGPVEVSGAFDSLAYLPGVLLASGNLSVSTPGGLYEGELLVAVSGFNGSVRGFYYASTGGGCEAYPLQQGVYGFGGYGAEEYGCPASRLEARGEAAEVSVYGRGSCRSAAGAVASRYRGTAVLLALDCCPGGDRHPWTGNLSIVLGTVHAPGTGVLRVRLGTLYLDSGEPPPPGSKLLCVELVDAGGSVAGSECWGAGSLRSGYSVYPPVPGENVLEAGLQVPGEGDYVLRIVFADPSPGPDYLLAVRARDASWAPGDG